MQNVGLRTYISEPDRGRQHWIGEQAERDAVYANRRRIRGERGQLLMRQRGELLERPNAHLYETGGMRRTHLRGHGNILKRLLVHVAACNLGLWMRTLTGIGTPRGLQGRLAAVGAFCFTLVGATARPSDRSSPSRTRSETICDPKSPLRGDPVRFVKIGLLPRAARRSGEGAICCWSKIFAALRL